MQCVVCPARLALARLVDAFEKVAILGTVLVAEAQRLQADAESSFALESFEEDSALRRVTRGSEDRGDEEQVARFGCRKLRDDPAAPRCCTRCLVDRADQDASGLGNLRPRERGDPRILADRDERAADGHDAGSEGFDPRSFGGACMAPRRPAPRAIAEIDLLAAGRRLFGRRPESSSLDPELGREFGQDSTPSARFGRFAEKVAKDEQRGELRTGSCHSDFIVQMAWDRRVQLGICSRS